MKIPAAARCCLFALMLASPARAAGVQMNVTFTQPAPLALGPEILHRAFTPIEAGSAQNIVGLPLDVAREKFMIYVPATKPPSGYALMVFVPPWDDNRLPPDWAPVLDSDSTIFVSANDSGNDKPVRTRRMPLALIAAQNIMHQYPVDPSRVFIAGFSGGSRVALRIAFAYPDVFRGAFLNSGSDPIGTTDNPLPTADLFRQVQQNSRFVFATGNLDQVPYNKQRATIASLADFCIAHVTDLTMWNKAHQAADEGTLSKGLDVLLNATPQPDDMADCRAKLDNTIQAQLQQVEALIASGDKAGARQLLDTINAKYGGLAAPKSLALNARLQ